MHRAALSHFNLEGSYELLDVTAEQLVESLKRYICDGFVGFNVTIPHKEAMFNLAQSHSKSASAAGAANTIKVENSLLSAHNTDLEGLKKALEPLLGEKKTAFVLGAGGASRAALLAMEELHFEKIVVCARDPSKAQATVAGVKLHHDTNISIVPLPSEPSATNFANSKEISNVSLILNTTPLGQAIKEIPHWFEQLLSHCLSDHSSEPGLNAKAERQPPLFFDMVYSATGAPTPLMEIANEHGWRSTDGTDMLVYQACAAFEFWTGNYPPYILMKEALEDARSLR